MTPTTPPAPKPKLSSGNRAPARSTELGGVCFGLVLLLAGLALVGVLVVWIVRSVEALGVPVPHAAKHGSSHLLQFVPVLYDAEQVDGVIWMGIESSNQRPFISCVRHAIVITRSTPS